MIDTVRLLFVNISKRDSLMILKRLIKQNYVITIIHHVDNLEKAREYQMEYNHNLIFINVEEILEDVFNYINLFSDDTIIWNLIIENPSYSFMRKAIKHNINDVILYKLLYKENFSNLGVFFSTDSKERVSYSDRLSILLSNIKDKQKINEKEIAEILRGNNLFINDEEYYLSIIRIDEIAYWYRLAGIDREKISEEFKNFIDKEVDSQIKTIFTKRHSVTLFFSKEKYIAEDVENILKTIKRKYKHEKFNISISFNKNSTNLINFKKTYEELIDIHDYKFYIGNNILITNEDYQFTKKTDISKFEKEILRWINRGSLKNSIYFINRLVDYMCLNKIDKEICKKIFYEIIDLYYEEQEDYTKKYFMPNIYKLLIRAAETYRSFKYFSKIIVRILIDYNIQKKLYENNKYITIAKEFVQKNIEKSINLEIISSYLDLSTSYFSRLFKEKTGESFIDYVNKKKIEYSKELLTKKNLPINKVSARLSYSSQFYFSKVFKKYEGKTPSEFKLENSGIKNDGNNK